MKLKAMVVDDSAIMIKNITQMLNELGHEVIHVCRSGQAACQEYGEHMPDIVTMDITMPDMDGIEATKRIIAEYPDAKIVMITSHGQENMVLDAIRAGAKGYILKPLKADKLKDIVDKVIEKYFNQ